MDDTLFQVRPIGARLHVRGSDAPTFLQGQFSNDLRRSEPRPVTYGMWLNHKGRVIADSHVLTRGPDQFDVISLDSPAAEIRKRLEAFIVADDVELDDQPIGMNAVEICGPASREAVHLIGLEFPSAGEFAEGRDGQIAFRARGSILLVGPGEMIANARSVLQGDARWREADADEVARCKIAAGIPSIPRDLGPDDLPQEGGIENDAISFSKGCYLGQEVMSRLHNLGQVRRRLFVVRMDGGRIPSTARLALRGVSGRPVGETRCLLADQSGAIGLAMLSLNAVTVGDRLTTESIPGATIEVVRMIGAMSAGKEP